MCRLGARLVANTSDCWLLQQFRADGVTSRTKSFLMDHFKKKRREERTTEGDADFKESQAASAEAPTSEGDADFEESQAASAGAVPVGEDTVL